MDAVIDAVYGNPPPVDGPLTECGCDICRMVHQTITGADQ